VEDFNLWLIAFVAALRVASLLLPASWRPFAFIESYQRFTIQHLRF